MKRLSMKNLMKFMWVLALAMAVAFTGCNKDDDDDDDDDVVIVLDGLYVKGDATAYTDFNDNARMAVTRNEVTQEERATLYELYIPVSATGGFNIVMVEGSNQTTYGPGGDFAKVANPTTDEPDDIWRGTYAETTDMFTVPADGMYHVVIDTELGKIAVVAVHWGLIGAATPDGWGASTPLNESAFDMMSMSWSITDMELRGGDWKFRYSNGWKVELDTTLDIGGGNVGVKVNTNFGEAVDNLVPGGANIVNDNPGVYDISLDYTLGDGYTATVTKTGDLPLTNWDGVECDAVGTGVSADNTNAIPDPSSWGWGNVLVADNGGVPMVNGDVYTWTWTDIVLEANEGFKLRTLNGVAPPSGNGANFDAGFSAIDVANSSGNVADDGGNITVTVKAAYDITLVIDAADNDSKTITITE